MKNNIRKLEDEDTKALLLKEREKAIKQVEQLVTKATLEAMNVGDNPPAADAVMSFASQHGRVIRASRQNNKASVVETLWLMCEKPIVSLTETFSYPDQSITFEVREVKLPHEI